MRASQVNYGQPSRTVIPLTKSRAFTARNHREPNFPFFWHYHPEWEIVFSHSGFGTRHVGTSVEKFVEGDLVMIPANVPHTWFSSSEQKEETYCSVIQFLPEAWGNFWHLQELGKFHQLCNKAQRGVRFDGAGLVEVGRMMEKLANHDVPSIRSLCSLLEIFDKLSELEMHSLHAVQESRSNWENPRLDDLLAWVEERLGEEMTQKDAAARVRMTPTAFSRWFKVNMGCQFQRYLNEIRVARVCSEIAHGKLSITEAAFKVGYNNLSNFNRRFMDITGLTPQAFRRQIHGGPLVRRYQGRKGGILPGQPIIRPHWSAPLNSNLIEDRIDPKWISDPD